MDQLTYQLADHIQSRLATPLPNLEQLPVLSATPSREKLPVLSATQGRSLTVTPRSDERKEPDAPPPDSPPNARGSAEVHPA